MARRWRHADLGSRPSALPHGAGRDTQGDRPRRRGDQPAPGARDVTPVLAAEDYAAHTGGRDPTRHRTRMSATVDHYRMEHGAGDIRTE